MGGAEAKTKGQVQAGRRVPGSGGEGQWFSSSSHGRPPVPTPAGEERPAPPGEVSREGLLQEGGDSDEEIWQRPHWSGPLHRVR